jgi:hypothetical protein
VTLTGKTARITGDTYGIGRAVAERMVATDSRPCNGIFGDSLGGDKVARYGPGDSPGPRSQLFAR